MLVYKSKLGEKEKDKKGIAAGSLPLYPNPKSYPNNKISNYLVLKNIHFMSCLPVQ